LLQEFTKSEGDSTRLGKLFELYRKVHSLTGNSAIAGLSNISQLSAALEALLKELYEKPKNINASSLRTVAQAIDFFAELVQHTANPEPPDAKPPRILVVDDDAISRRAIVFALEKANLHPIALEDPMAALRMLEENFFDLIFLDVEMPGMNGFSLCARIRTMLGHEKTPVVFVTSLGDFQSRARSTLSGGNDLIAKPFLFVELSVKALLYVLRSRL
jgi:CheY-like chemotaxis protein